MSAEKVRSWQEVIALDRAWLLTRIAGGALAAFLLVGTGLAARSPALAPRVGVTALTLAAVAGATIWLARRQRQELGAVVLLAGCLLLVTGNALRGGGILSPGIQAYFLFVVLGGLLLGWRGAVGLALAIVAVSGWLVALDRAGSLPPPVVAYDAFDRWLFVLLYTAIALLVVLAAERTHRRLFDARERESEARAQALRQLETVLEVGGYGRFVHDIGTQRYRPDDVLVALSGLRPDADGTAAFAAWHARIYPEDRARADESVAPILRGEVERVHVAYRFLHPEKGLRHFDAALLLQRDPDGSPSRVSGVLLDLTAQQETIDRLGERLKEMRLLYHAAHALRGEQIDVVGALGALVQRIPEAFRFPALAEARLALDGLDLRTPGWTGAGLCIESALSGLPGVGSLSVEYRERPPMAREPDFLPEEVELLGALASLVSSWCAAAEERSRFRQIEERMQQAQRLEAVGTFAAGIAHDFNNVLTAVIATAEAAKGSLSASGGDAVRDLEQIIAAGHRGQALVRRIRRLGQRETLKRRAVSLSALITEVVALARSSAPPGVSLDAECAPDVPHAWADASQLHQVLLNLLSNAFHATRETGGSVVVRAAAAPPPPGTGRARSDCVVTVTDTGVGMPANVAARIFEPFFTTKGAEGTGLGLAMVYGIMRDHEGSVQVRSAPGQGTTFTLRLPSAPTGSDEAATSSPPSEVGDDDRRTTARGARVLIVDDDPAVLRAHCRVLERSGFVCAGSTDPSEALERFAGEPDAFAVVLSDLHMPSVSGLDLIRRVRAIKPGVPAVLFSGVDLSGAAVMLEQEGIGWATKPATPRELIGAIERALGERV